MSPILKRALWREWLHQSGLVDPLAWAAVGALVTVFAVVGTLEGVM